MHGTKRRLVRKRKAAGHLARLLAPALLLSLTPALATNPQVCNDLMCYPVPNPPTSPNCGSVTIPSGHTTGTVTGTVTDVRGVPLSGVSLYWSYGCATSSATGTFRIAVWTDNPVSMTAVKDQYAYSTITSATPLTATWNFQLQFAIAAGSNPSAFNASMHSITFNVYTTAPVAGTKVEITLPASLGGQTLNLSYVASFAQPQGNWSQWTSSAWTVPASLADGQYLFHACAIDALATGTSCDVPGGTTLALANNPDPNNPTTYFYKDNSPPTMTSTGPGAPTVPDAFSDVTSAPTISATFSDALSGVDVSSLTMSVDGTRVAATVSGTTISASGTGLAAGVHLVTASAQDLAANKTTSAFLFTIASLSATAANATLQQQVVPVNPNGTIPPPTTATFSNPPISLGSYSVSMTGSTQTGYGPISRSITLGNTQVVFSNPSGASTSVTVGLPQAQTTQTVMVAAPFLSSGSVSISATTSSLPSITVNVPTGFSVSGSTATLQSTAAALGPAAFPGPGPLSNPNPPSYRLALVTSVCAMITATCNPLPSIYNAYAYSTATGWLPVWAEANGPKDTDGTNALIDPGCASVNDTTRPANPCGQVRVPSPTSTRTPYPCPVATNTPSYWQRTSECGQSNFGPTSDNGAQQYGAASVALGCSERYLQENLCTGTPVADQNFATLFENVFAYSQKGCTVDPSSDTCASQLVGTTPAHFALWQQDHAAPASIGICPMNLNGGVQAVLQELHANYLSQASASQPGPTYVPGYVATSDLFALGTDSVDSSGPVYAAELGPTSSRGNGATSPGPGTLKIEAVLNPAYHHPPSGSVFSSGLNVWIDTSATIHNVAGTDPLTGVPYDPTYSASSWWPQAGYTGSGATQDLEMFSGADLNATSPPSGPTALATSVALFGISNTCS